MIKPVYISATIQDSGKTCVSMGLIQALQRQNLNPGYFKPVGQHYKHYHNINVDEDAVLVHEVFNLSDEPYNLSPIAIEHDFTRKFIFNPDISPLEAKILNSAQKLRKLHQVLIVEGTGHAGVGSCFGLSNARVAQLLAAKVIIVTAGGIGKPIDEVAVNTALFKQHNVEVIGVILNKVLPEKYENVSKTVAQGLKNLGIKLIAAIPYEKSLTFFTVGQVAEEFKYDILSGQNLITNRIENIVIAAMEPQHALKYIHENTLIITPSDRIDTIQASTIALSKYHQPNSGGLLLTGGQDLSPAVKQLLQTSDIPVLISNDDTFKVSSKMSDLRFKIRSCDTDKIARLYKLVEEYVDTKQLLQALSE